MGDTSVPSTYRMSTANGPSGSADPLATLVHRARELGERFEGILPEVFTNTFPAATVSRIVFATMPLYHAAVDCLGSGSTALASQALMRPMNENWLHLHFIAGDDNLDEAACRALQVELGWAIWTWDLMDATGDAAAIAIADERMKGVKAVVAEHGCAEQTRDFRKISRHAKEISAEPGWDWVLGAWKSASQVAHGSGWEWLLRPVHGHQQWSDPDPDCRAGWLNNMLVLFNNFAQTVLYLLGYTLDHGPAHDLHTETMQLLDDPILVLSR